MKSVIEVLTPEMENTYSDISRTNLLFFKQIIDNPKAMIRAEYSDILKLNNKYSKIQPWPIFISSERINQDQIVINSIFRLIKEIPDRIFLKNIRNISQYYAISEGNVAYQLQSIGADLRHLVGRADFMISSDGLKLLEFNIAANLGGWETINWERAYLGNPIISGFITSNKIEIVNNHLMEDFFKHLLNCVGYTLNNSDAEANILIGDYNYNQDIALYKATELSFNQLYRYYLRENGLKRTGKIIMYDYSQSRIVNNVLYHGNDKIHVVVEMNHGRVPEEIVRLAKEKRLVLLNGPITNLLSSKLNLAVLSENSKEDVFTEEEKKIIQKHIPWTRKLRQINTVYKGKHEGLRDIVLSNKDAMVIKKADGFGGSDVFLGKQQTPGEWSDLIDSAITENGWLVQEYIESCPFLFQCGDDGCAVHNAVFGGFICGSSYIGSFIRILPQKNKNAIINAHQGAEVGSVIHVRDSYTGVSK